MAWFLKNAFFCSVNAFAILSGYLYAKSDKVKYGSILNLILVTFVYCVVILIAFYYFYPQYLTGVKAYVSALFPPSVGGYWYLTSYVFLFVMIPYINTVFRHLSKKQFQKLILLCFLLLSFIPTFTTADLFRVNDGYSPFWLIYCYGIGVYIREHGFPKVLSWSNSLFLFMASTVILLVFKESITILTVNMLGLGKPYGSGLLLAYTSPLVLLNAIFLFRIFYKINIQNKFIQKLILSISGAAFSVYIIHSHILVYDNLLRDSFISVANHNFLVALSIILGGIVGIYLACWIIDFVRKFLFKLLKIDALCAQLGRRLDDFFQKDKIS